MDGTNLYKQATQPHSPAYLNNGNNLIRAYPEIYFHLDEEQDLQSFLSQHNAILDRFRELNPGIEIAKHQFVIGGDSTIPVLYIVVDYIKDGSSLAELDKSNADAIKAMQNIMISLSNYYASPILQDNTPLMWLDITPRQFLLSNNNWILVDVETLHLNNSATFYTDSLLSAISLIIFEGKDLIDGEMKRYFYNLMSDIYHASPQFFKDNIEFKGILKLLGLENDF